MMPVALNGLIRCEKIFIESLSLKLYGCLIDRFKLDDAIDRKD